MRFWRRTIEIEGTVKDGILVPWRKSEPERYKTALQLFTVDKGGLTYQPKIGAFEGVAEIDYASMYPSLMVTRNISPETVLCSCCDNQVVPEAEYNICAKRRGLIPLTLAPLVERRQRLKDLMRGAEDERTRAVYDARRTAIKWMLVSCFGYMGYLSSGGRLNHRRAMCFTLFTYKRRRPREKGIEQVGVVSLFLNNQMLRMTQ